MASARGPSSRLALILEEIGDARLSKYEVQLLRQHAVQAAMEGPRGRVASPRGTHTADAMAQLEAILVVVGGGERVGISQAKTLLAQRGSEGSGLAKRVAKLSKVRNGQAHPDVTLLNAVTKCMRDIEGDLTSEPEEEAGMSGSSLGRPWPAGAQKGRLSPPCFIEFENREVLRVRELSRS